MKPYSPPFTRFDAWRAPSFSCTLLLLISALFHENDLVNTLQGGTLDDELNSARVVGYYEQLIEATRPGERLGSGWCEELSSDKPPPGWLNFAGADLLEREHSFLRFRLRPNLNKNWNGNAFTTNRLGYRSPDVVSPKPKGVYRIVVIGSSNTMGQGVADEDVFVRKFERWLNDRQNGLGKRVEVVNLAVSSDAPSQQTYRLAVDAAKLEADWILNDATFFDMSLEARHLRDIFAKGLEIPFPRLVDALSNAHVRLEDPMDLVESKLMRSIEPVLASIYAGFAAEAKKLGAPMTILLLPRADKASSNPNLKRLFKTLSEENGLEFFDLSDSFRDLAPENFRAAPWEKHPSRLGHQRIFEELRKDVLRRGGLPGLDQKAAIETGSGAYD